MHPLIFLTQQPGEILYIYLAVSKHTVRVVLFRSEKNDEKTVYYVSKALLEVE